MKVVMIAIDEMTIILGDNLSNDHNDCHRHQDKVSSEMTAKKTRVCFVYKTTYCLFPHFLFSSSWLLKLTSSTMIITQNNNIDMQATIPVNNQ